MHICNMTNKEYNQLMDALLKQREEILSSKEAGKKLLVDSGIYHLFVPKDTSKKKGLSNSK